MAIDKIGSKALVDCSVAAADIAPGTITTAKLAGSITNAKLANSTVTINGTAIALGASASIAALSWQSVVVSDGSTVTTMVAGRGYFVNNTSAAGIVKLPASASAGDTIAIKDYAGNFGTNKLTIQRNSHKIQGVANDSQISTNRASVQLVYIDATKGWLFTNESNVGSLGAPLFTEATGGTITTTGNFKVHSFTGDGNFVVSQIGNAPTGGPANVDYLVVAGGGGGGRGDGAGGGGGAGGHRTSFPSPSCNAGAFPVAVQTYPITVGAGGTGGSPNGNPAEPSPVNSTSGSNSIFSTITSAGGGAGGNGNSPAPIGQGSAGGSGGGSTSGPFNGLGDYYCGLPGGAGNTPPVSPSQGNNGGSGHFHIGVGGSPMYQNTGAGGGGGAGGVGANMGPGGPAPAAAGGNGTANSITGSPVTRAGGGGGGLQASPGNRAGGAAGPGGGGVGSNKGDGGGPVATAGSANTGGGGGGASSGCAFSPGHLGAAGGKGIVIIRYKYQ